MCIRDRATAIGGHPELFVQGTRTAGVAEGGVDQRAEEGFEHGTVNSETFCLTKVDTGRCVRRDRRVLAARTTLSLWAPRARVGCPVESCSGTVSYTHLRAHET